MPTFFYGTAASWAHEAPQKHACSIVQTTPTLDIDLDPSRGHVDLNESRCERQSDRVHKPPGRALLDAKAHGIRDGRVGRFFGKRTTFTAAPWKSGLIFHVGPSKRVTGPDRWVAVSEPSFEHSPFQPWSDFCQHRGKLSRWPHLEKLHCPLSQ